MEQEDPGFILFPFWCTTCSSSAIVHLPHPSSQLSRLKLHQSFFPLFPLEFSVGWNRLFSLAGRDPGVGGGAGKETKALELKDRIRKQQDPALTLLQRSHLFVFCPEHSIRRSGF